MGIAIDRASGYNYTVQNFKSAAPNNEPQKADEDGAVFDAQKSAPELKQKPAEESDRADKSGNSGDKAENPQEEAKIQQQIQELLQIQNKVIIHEQAHMSAGGEFAGGASYSYTTGPDGKRYITGGEVAISTPAVKEPEDKIRVMAKVQAAALAPADPSPQDMRVAASASAQEAQARMELARTRAEAAYGGAAEKGKSRDADIEGANQSIKPDREAYKNKELGSMQKNAQKKPGGILDFSI